MMKSLSRQILDCKSFGALGLRQVLTMFKAAFIREYQAVNGMRLQKEQSGGQLD